MTHKATHSSPLYLSVGQINIESLKDMNVDSYTIEFGTSRLCGRNEFCYMT
jgi:hypothetical protein